MDGGQAQHRQPLSDFTLSRLTGLLTTEAEVDWRHDIDFEQAFGVQSTFYVMARSEHYNAFAPSNIQLFREIVERGHMLGIHVDLQLPRDAQVSTPAMAYACGEDRALLSRVLPVVNAVSFHAPPRDVYWRDVPGFEHALGPEWQNRYVADSRGVFQYGDPEEFLTRGHEVQVGLHPEWWFWPDDIANEARKREALKP